MSPSLALRLLLCGFLTHLNGVPIRLRHQQYRPPRVTAYLNPSHPSLLSNNSQANSQSQHSENPNLKHYRSLWPPSGWHRLLVNHDQFVPGLTWPSELTTTTSQPTTVVTLPNQPSDHWPSPVQVWPLPNARVDRCVRQLQRIVAANLAVLRLKPTPWPWETTTEFRLDIARPPHPHSTHQYDRLG